MILYWNAGHDCPVFKVDREERDFLIEADPATFFTTDHHRPWPLVLARPERLDPGLGAGEHRAGVAGAGEEADAQGLGGAWG